MKLLLAAGIVLALAAGGWALFLRSTDDHGKTLTIGAPRGRREVLRRRRIAEEQVAFAKQAGFDALDITTAWSPGQTEPDPGELALLRGVADATQKAGIQLLITAYAAKPRFAPMTDEEQDNYAQYMASLARSLPSVDAFAVWNEPNLNGFWLDQFDESGNDIAATAYEALLAKTYDALKAVSPKLKVYGGNLAPRGFDDADSSRPTHSPTQFIQDLGTAYRAERPHEADHGRLRAAPVPDPLVDPARDSRTPERPSGSATTTSSSRCSARPSTARASRARSSRSRTRSSASSRSSRRARRARTRTCSRRSARTPCPRRRRPTTTEQAFELAACQPTVIAFYIFHLFDEADLNRWQSGPVLHGHEAEVEPRPRSREAAKKARDGKLGDCS